MVHIQRDFRYGGFGIHRILKPESRNFLMITLRFTSLSDGAHSKDVFDTVYLHVASASRRLDTRSSFTVEIRESLCLNFTVFWSLNRKQGTIYLDCHIPNR
jgi:hypothetical protein